MFFFPVWTDSTGTETTARQKGKAGMARNSSGEEVYSSGEEASSGWTVEESKVSEESKVFEEFKNLEIGVSLKRKGVVDSKYQWLQEQSARQGALHGRTDLQGETGFFETRTDITEGQTDFKQGGVVWFCNMKFNYFSKDYVCICLYRLLYVALLVNMVGSRQLVYFSQILTKQVYQKPIL